MESTMDISIPPPSFKPVSLSLSRISSISKNNAKQVFFFNPIKYIFLTSFLPQLYYTVFYNITV